MVTTVDFPLVKLLDFWFGGLLSWKLVCDAPLIHVLLEKYFENTGDM